MIDLFNEDKEFNNEDFSGELLQGIECVACKFSNCNFSNTDLSHCDFMDCIFDNCNFSLVKVNNTGLKNIRLLKSKITGVDFSACKDFLLAFHFEGCTIDYCSFWGKKLKKTNFRECSIKESDFSEADLTGAAFNNCDLLNTVFKGTKLEKADFRTAANYIIDPEQNHLKKARFSIHGLPGLLAKYDIHIE